MRHETDGSSGLSMHHRWIQIQGRVVVTKPADWNCGFHSRDQGLDHQEEDAVLWKPEAGCPYPHYPHTWGTSWKVAGAVCSTASLRKTREMRAQSSHAVSPSFALQFVQYIVSLHHFRLIKALGSEGWAEASMQRQASAKQKST